ncbi:MAG: hypothetical protein AW07_00884 [Candidatus Accumulibacter sp. SK-11]|nr:MAG: hypothetical protein AW07_00884 [Candidatus Accumulibacter sp. SK-11]
MRRPVADLQPFPVGLVVRLSRHQPASAANTLEQAQAIKPHLVQKAVHFRRWDLPFADQNRLAHSPDLCFVEARELQKQSGEPPRVPQIVKRIKSLCVDRSKEPDGRRSTGEVLAVPVLERLIVESHRRSGPTDSASEDTLTRRHDA